MKTLLLKTCLIFIIACIGNQAYSQNNIIFKDDFDGNKPLFNTANSDCCKKEISDSRLHFKHLTTGTDWSYTKAEMNGMLDYVLEGVFQFRKGKGHMGLVFSSSGGNKDVYLFGLDESGNYVLFGWPDGKYKAYLNGICTSYKKTKDNHIRVEKRGRDFIFYVNDVKCVEYKNARQFGKYFGYFASGEIEYECDYITLKQDYEKKAINLAPNMPSTIAKKNLGPNVNSKYDEKSPVISADGKTIYFVTGNNPESVGGKEDSDIYYAVQDETGNWQPRKPIGPPLNNKSHNAVISVTPDNNSLLLNGVYKDGNSYIGMSISNKTDMGWSMPKNLEIKNHYNRNIYEERCLSANRKVLILAVERDDSYGDKDLYVSFQNEDETWSEPMNMGPVVNSDNSEISPFLAADGTTLYFASSGHSGYGDADIFVSKRLDDSWTKWSTPENLGNQINSPYFDAYFTIPASGSYAYMVSGIDAIGGIDIIQLDLPNAIKPKAVILVTGTVYNAKTNKPIESKITYKDLLSDTEKGIAFSSANDGTYKIILQSGEVYSFLAEKTAFISTSDNLDTRNQTEYLEIKRDLYLTPIEVGQTIRLNNVFFDVDKHDLKDESFAELNRVVKLLKDNPDMNIEVSGNTDATGNEAKNLTLSQNRADAVKSYLVSQGIESKRIKSVGNGQSKPVADNATEDGRKLNRRVEFTILGN
jgi:outer membrane protein OmpA-like peptidoglycan-associated protein